MKQGYLTIVPNGGLGNRMRAIASAYHACRQSGSRMQAVWFMEHGMQARFSDIFQTGRFHLREAGLADYLFNDWPRRRNLWLPWLPQRLLYQRLLTTRKVGELKEQDFDFASWVQGHRCYMECCHEFGNPPRDLYATLFHPVEEVMQVVAARESRFSSYTVGMHIRRTDHAAAIAQSPTRLFIEAGRRELAAHPDLKIFLATDSQEVKDEMRQAFAGRIITPAEEASRESLDGIRGGLADMWTLSRTRRIYGSVRSSFSEIASKIGGCELITLSVSC